MISRGCNNSVAAQPADKPAALSTIEGLRVLCRVPGEAVIDIDMFKLPNAETTVCAGPQVHELHDGAD